MLLLSYFRQYKQLMIINLNPVVMSQFKKLEHRTKTLNCVDID